MALSDSDIRGLARLARLELSEAEIALHRRHINALIERFDALQRVDVSGVEPTAQIIPLHTVLRQDDVGESLPREEALANAPAVRDARFAVPRILGDTSRD